MVNYLYGLILTFLPIFIAFIHFDDIFPKCRLVIYAHLMERVIKVLLSLLKNVRIYGPSFIISLVEFDIKKLMIL